MGNLADQIEEYIKRILEKAEDGYIILQRSALAGAFSCAPSQINYVLDTRFTVERGYLVESRRGGGGYLRIVRLALLQEGDFQYLMRQLIGDQLSPERVIGLCDRLSEETILTTRECALVKSVLSRESLGEGMEANLLRARIMKTILTTLSREDL